jgi:ATP-dependent Lon protease
MMMIGDGRCAVADIGDVRHSSAPAESAQYEHHSPHSVNPSRVSDRRPRSFVARAVRAELQKHEMAIHMINSDIEQAINVSVMDASRRAMLLAKKQDIERQLGTGKGVQTVDKFKQRLVGKDVPAPVMTVINEEFDRLTGLESHSSE